MRIYLHTASLFGVSADTLMRMQANHDLAQARAHEADIRVTPLAA